MKKVIHILASGLDKKYRYGIGKELEDGCACLLKHILFAKHNSKHNKSIHILQAIVQLDMCQFTIRMMLDLKIGNETTLFSIHEQTAEIGRMLGGWLKSLK